MTALSDFKNEDFIGIFRVRRYSEPIIGAECDGWKTGKSVEWVSRNVSTDKFLDKLRIFLSMVLVALSVFGTLGYP